MADDREMLVVNTQCAVMRGDRILMIVRGYGVDNAPGVLAFPGGKVEIEDGPADVLESAVRHEVFEETGITVSAGLKYVRSKTFDLKDGTPVVDVLFLGEYEDGEPEITDPDEVAEIRWMTMEEILAHDKTSPRLKYSLDRVEALRPRSYITNTVMSRGTASDSNDSRHTVGAIHSPGLLAGRMCQAMGIAQLR